MKKTYISPDFKVVVLKSRPTLLSGSVGISSGNQDNNAALAPSWDGGFEDSEIDF